MTYLAQNSEGDIIYMYAFVTLTYIFDMFKNMEPTEYGIMNGMNIMNSVHNLCTRNRQKKSDA